MMSGLKTQAPRRKTDSRGIRHESWVLSLGSLLCVTALLVWLIAPRSVWAADAGVRIWLPEGITTTSPAIDQLFYLILWLTGGVFVLVQITLLVFLVLYRQRPGRAATYTHGSSLVEIIWTVIPAIILALLAFRSQHVWSSVRGTPPPEDLRIEVTAQQFAWNIHYPGPDHVLGRTDITLVDEAANPIGLNRNDPYAADDLVTVNQLHLPVDKTVLIDVRSKDVIHSFFVPQFRMKLDAVPGLTGHLWVKATKSGAYEIACAELCGLGHYRMRGFLVVEPDAAFQEWWTQMVKEQG